MPALIIFRSCAAEKILLNPLSEPFPEQHKRRRGCAITDQKAAAKRWDIQKRNTAYPCRVGVIPRKETIEGSTAVILDMEQHLIVTEHDGKVNFGAGFLRGKKKRGKFRPLSWEIHLLTAEIGDAYLLMPEQGMSAVHHGGCRMCRQHSALQPRKAAAQIHDDSRVDDPGAQSRTDLIIFHTQDLRGKIGIALPKVGDVIQKPRQIVWDEGYADSQP